MKTIYLSDYTGGDDRERIARALADAKTVHGTTLVIEPGVYNLTSERSREIRDEVIGGAYGADPERTMFRPDFSYDRGIDLDGHDGTVVDGTGARFMIDGFMEDISVRNCRGVTVRGFEIDNVRKPYTKATVTSTEAGVADCRLAFPIIKETPIVRTAVYSHRLGRFIPEICDFESLESLDGDVCRIKLKGDASAVAPRDEIYLCHTFHFRPSVLIENAKDVRIENVTVHSHAGMGMTAFHGENIALSGFRVVPSEGEHFSTNTDATHFTSCRGTLRLEGCEFEGQGDDGINVHTYYYTPVARDGRTLTLKISSPTWTHTQKMDYPLAGDVFEMNDKRSLKVVERFNVVSSVHDDNERTCTVTLDRKTPENLEGYLFSAPGQTPSLEVVRCSFKNHFARGMTLKARKCYIDSCDMTDLFELPIKLAAEAYWQEGVGCEEMTVRNCRFVGCGRLKYCVPRFECGGIEVFTDAPEHEATNGSVVIENNYIECPDCDHGMMLRDVERAALSNNTVISRCEPVVIGDGVIKEK